MQEVALMHCNVVTVIGLFRFVLNKQFGQLVTISEFSFIELSFADQNDRPLEIEDNMKMTLIVRIT